MTDPATAIDPVRATGLPLAPGPWALDPFHSQVGFAIRHLGVSKVRGRFSDVRAELVVGATPEDTSVTATVALASIDTGNADRDAHVRAPDLLDVEKRPTMSFRSVGIDGAGSDWVLDGELTIGDVTRPLRLEVELGGVEPFFDGTRHAGFEATGELRRGDLASTSGPPTRSLATSSRSCSTCSSSSRRADAAISRVPGPADGPGCPACSRNVCSPT